MGRVSEEGQGPPRAVEPMMMMIMNCLQNLKKETIEKLIHDL